MDFNVRVHSARYAAIARWAGGLQDELIYSGHVTALGAPAKILLVSSLLGITMGILPLIIAYVATLIVYSFDYFSSADNDASTNPGRAAYFSGMAGSFLYRILICGAVLVVSLTLYANVWLTLVVVSMALAGIAYPALFKKLTRYVPGFKNVYTSGVWTSGIILGVLACGTASTDTAVALLFLFLFMRSLGNVVFFDLKDVASDRAEGLATLPVLLGSERTFALLRILNVASFLPLAAGALAGMLPPYALTVVAIGFFTFYYLGQARGRPHDYLSYLPADAETLLWPVILLVAGGISTL